MVEPPAPTPAVQLNAVCKRYGDKTVLHALDLAVPPGQVLGYVGPNGAGKSTTIKILVGLLGAFEGEARVDGIDVRADPLEVKRRIGYVPEVAMLYESLTVHEHLLLVGRMHGLADDTTTARATGMLRAFDLEGRLHSSIGALSKGMRQKLLFTAALLHDPRILFLDEPLSGLDVQSTVLVKELVRALAAAGKTIVYCSHMLDVVERVCDRIVVLQAGRVVADGAFAALKEQSRGGGTLEQIFLELTADDGATERARQVLAASRAQPNMTQS